MPDSLRSLQSTYSRSIVWAALLAVACGASNGANDGNAGSGGQAGSTTTSSGVAGRDGVGGQAGANTNSAGGGNGGLATHDDGGPASTQDGGGPESGGHAGTGLDASDSSDHQVIDDSRGPDIACRDDGGSRLASAARICQLDSDCAITVRVTCCGSDNAFGIAKSAIEAYANCYALAPGACQGLGCAKFSGYATDNGELTQRVGAPTNSLSEVAVHCTQHLCTTTLAVAKDAGND
jgi:hypothetical protein